MVNATVGYDVGFLVELTASQEGVKLVDVADFVVCIVVFEDHFVDYVSDLCQVCKSCWTLEFVLSLLLTWK